MSKELLEELILNINDRTGIRNEILEKDYYVCVILKELALKQNELKAYFKGGTAVYKILNHMNRFSEDIDLTVKVIDTDTNNSNKIRLKKSALNYKNTSLELMKDETIDNKGSITAFYKYDTLFGSNELFNSERIQIESTSFTVSEPVGVYTIEPLIYKYATDEEKQILKNQYNLCEFEIKIIKLERIFIDKVFAAEFYYERKMYSDVSKHLYDISILMKEGIIQKFLDNKNIVKQMISYKRQEEKVRIGGIKENKKMSDFEYLKCNFNDDLKKAFDNMQRIYVLDDSSKISIEEVINTIKKLYKIIKELENL